MGQSDMGAFDPFGWVGSTIDGQFVVEAVAGEGAFGIVYRGTHIGFQAPIAIKCLKIPLEFEDAQREGFLSMFRTEARLLHRLSRRTMGIVQALDVGAASSPKGTWTPYLVMEWLDGETLEDDLRRRRAAALPPRSVEETVRLLAPAAAALSIAHEERVSHRDIKPANIFLVNAKSDVQPKILDFGVAKVFAEAGTRGDARSPTGGGFRAFTPQYGAPEQFSPLYGATGPWTDVYAMALLFIEIASGQPAFTGTDMIQLAFASCDEQHRPSLRARGVNVVPPVEAVIAKALSVRSSLRFRDIGEMWTALDAALGVSVAMAPTVPIAADMSRTERTPPTFEPRAERQKSSSGPSAGESRVCTVMFVDLSAVTDLSTRLDADDITELLGRAVRVVVEQVDAMGGIVGDAIGDRVLAAFGISRATDNDAERAVLAGLRIQAALGRVSLPRAVRSSRLTARIGIATGRVFAGAAPLGGRGQLAVLGEAVNLAARLQQIAPKETIAVGRDTYRQVVGLFNMEPFAAAGAGGEALPVYRVAGAIALRHAIGPSDFHGVETKLRGRAAERQRLLDALDTVRSERRAELVTLIGPPGVGRSRMLADLFAEMSVREESFLVMASQGSPLAEGTSYGFVATLIRRRFEILDTDPAPVIRKKLRRGVRWLRLYAGRRPHERWNEEIRLSRHAVEEVDDALGPIEAILGTRPTVTSASQPMAPDDAGSVAKPRIASAIARLIRFAAARVPVVVLCDDIQWADDASLDLLDDVVLRVEDMPVLVVCAARPEIEERRPGWGAGKAAQQRVDLTLLARRYIEEMIRDRLRWVRDLSPEFVRLLADRAEGSPLTLVETLHLLVDAGVIETKSGDAWTVHQARLGALALPTTIRGIVQGRLDRLDPEVRGALAEAAVVGRTFWEGAVARLWHEEPQGSPSASVAGLLDRLRDRKLTRERIPSTFAGEREYVVAEAATWEVAYEILPIKVRQRLHHLAASWLEERSIGQSGAALLALHYERGGDPGRAAAEYSRAAAHAASLGENAEALRHFERARDIHDEATGDDPGETVEERRIASFRDRVRLRLELGDTLRRMGRLDEAERMYEEARARILRVERRRGAAIDPADVLRWDARVDFRLALVERVRGATAKALDLVGRAIASATEGKAEGELPAMYAVLAFLNRRARNLVASWKAALDGLRVCRRAQRRDEKWREDVAQILLGVAAVRYSRARWVSAERTYRQALRAVSEATHPHLAAVVLNGLAAARLGRGERRGAREALVRSLRLKERVGDLHQIAIAYSNLAEVEISLAEIPAALEHARRAVRLGEQVRAGADLADMYKNLAEALLEGGVTAEALVTGRKALELARSTGRIYLGGVAVALARACARAAVTAAPGDDLHAQVVEAASALRASLAEDFEDPDLRRRAEECRAHLARAFLWP